MRIAVIVGAIYVAFVALNWYNLPEGWDYLLKAIALMAAPFVLSGVRAIWRQ